MMNACQSYAGCTARRAFEVTYESAPVVGGGQSHPGMRWSEGVCKGHASTRKDQVEKEGGKIVDVETLPEPPAPPVWAPEIEPVAVAVEVAPAPTPEPPVRRRRARGKGTV